MAVFEGNDDPNVQVEHFQKLLLDKLDIFFPEKEVKISNVDLPFMTMELKLLDRQKKREYRKHKKSEKYLTLQSKYQVLFNNTSRSYFNNVIDNLMTSKPGSAYSLLKKLGSRPGDSEDASYFSLPNHTEGNFSAQQSADAIA